MGKIWIEQSYLTAPPHTGNLGTFYLASGRIELTSSNNARKAVRDGIDTSPPNSAPPEEVDMFQERMSRMTSALTRSELHVCGLIRKGVSTKDIGAQLGTSQHTVFTHRKSIRRKLGLDPKESLYSVLIRI